MRVQMTDLHLPDFNDDDMGVTITIVGGVKHIEAKPPKQVMFTLMSSGPVTVEECDLLLELLKSRSPFLLLVPDSTFPEGEIHPLVPAYVKPKRRRS